MMLDKKYVIGFQKFCKTQLHKEISLKEAQAQVNQLIKIIKQMNKPVSKKEWERIEDLAERQKELDGFYD